MLKMIELDHRFVVVGGLIVACLFYQVPFYTIVAVCACGCVVYARNRYKKGDRVSLGLTGIRFTRQAKTQGRLRISSPPKSSPNVTPKTLFSPKSQPWGTNLSLTSSPISPCDYGTYNQCRGYLKLRMLQSSLNHGSEKDCPELSPRGNCNANPNCFQKQTTMSFGSKMDSSLNKPDTSYNDICQAKYAGVGIYPVVHLEPSLPILLSNFNSSMTKNRVTVKVAPREKVSRQTLRSQSLQNASSNTQDPDGSMVMEALKKARKRSLKEEANEAIQKRQKVDMQSVNPPFLNSPVRFMPNGVSPHFNSHVCDGSMQILPPHFASEREVASIPSKLKLFKRLASSGRDSIQSSYSSSQKMTKMGRRCKLKRKPELASLDMPGNKVICNREAPTELKSPTTPDQTYPSHNIQSNNELKITSLEESISSNVTPETPVENVSDRHSISLELKPHSPLTRTRSSTSMYIPSYIPTLDDYLQDKKLKEQRLQKMLNAISGNSEGIDERDKTSIHNAIAIEPSVQEGPATTAHLPMTTAAAVATTAPTFSFGIVPLVSPSVPLQTGGSILSENKASSNDGQSSSGARPTTDITTASTLIPPQASNITTTSSTPKLSLNFGITPTSNVSSTPGFVYTSNVTASTLAVASSAPSLSSPFGSSFMMSAPVPNALKPLPAPISLMPSMAPFGQIATASTSIPALAVNSITTSSSTAPFSSALGFNFGTPVSTARNTSTVASVTNPLFSFGPSVTGTVTPAFNTSTGAASLGASASSFNHALTGATAPVTSVPSLFNAPNPKPSTGAISFSAFGSQPFNSNAVKGNIAASTIQSSALPINSTPHFGATTSVGNRALPGYLFNAGPKAFATNRAPTSSPFSTNITTATGLQFAKGVTTASSPFAASGTTTVNTPFATSITTGSSPFATIGMTAPSLPFARNNTAASSMFATTSTTAGSPFQLVNNTASNNGHSAAGGFTFGQTQTAAPSGAGQNSMFSSPNSNHGFAALGGGQPSSFGAASNMQPSFGSGNNNLTGFGTPSLNTAAPPAFGAGTSGFALKPFAGVMFGAGAGSGDSNNAGFVSSNASGMSGGATNGNLPSYASSVGNVVPAFGGSAAQLSGGGFSFGNATTTAPNMFGSSSAISTNSSTAFQFNGVTGNQSNAGPFASPLNNVNASFQFNGPAASQSSSAAFSSPTSNNNNNNANMGSPFAFKNQQTQQSSGQDQGFNFNPGAKPSFNFGSEVTSLSDSSMFSVGMGSVAPRQGKTSLKQRLNR